jgi:hypothetical protein
LPKELEEPALFPFAVGVLGAVKAPLGAGHFAQDVVQRLFDDPAEKRVTAGLIRMQVDAAEQCGIIKHFLKVVLNTQYVFCAHRAVGAEWLLKKDVCTKQIRSRP